MAKNLMTRSGDCVMAGFEYLVEQAFGLVRGDYWRAPGRYFARQIQDLKGLLQRRRVGLSGV